MTSGSTTVQFVDHPLYLVIVNQFWKFIDSPKRSLIRAFSSAALQLTRSESSLIVSIFAPLRRRSTSEARLSSLASALSRAWRRRECRIVLCWRFSSHRQVTYDVLCSHSLSFRCSAHTNIAAMSAQYGTSRLAAEAVRPMVDSAADSRACSTEFCLSLAVVFTLR